MGTTGENIKGTAKEAVGEALDKDDLEREGEQQQKAQKQEEAAELHEAADDKGRSPAGMLSRDDWDPDDEESQQVRALAAALLTLSGA